MLLLKILFLLALHQQIQINSLEEFIKKIEKQFLIK